MRDRLLGLGCPASFGATTVLGAVFLWRLPLLAQVAGYLALVATAVGVVALTAAVRMARRCPDGRVLAVGAAGVALVGQVLNATAGLPAAEELAGAPGPAGWVVLVCALLVMALGVRDLRRTTPVDLG